MEIRRESAGQAGARASVGDATIARDGAPGRGRVGPERVLGALASGGTALFGLLGLLGWLTPHRLLASANPAYIPMAPATAGAFLVLALGIGAALSLPPPWRGRVAGLAALVVGVLGLVVGAAFLLGLPSPLETWLTPDPGNFGAVTVGRMAPLTTALFLLAALSLAWARHPKQADRAGALGTLILGASAVVFLGYVYGEPLLYGGPVIPVALTTALAFALVGLGLIAVVGSGHFPLRPFVGSAARARLLRAFLPLTVLLLVVQGLIDRVVLVGLNPALLDALSTLGATLIVSGLVARTALVLGSALDRSEREREGALAALQESNQRLEAALVDVQRTQEQIVQHERLHAMGEMAAGLAHDFNNALSLILGFAELLLVRPQDLERRELVVARLQAIHSAATSAADLVRRLRAFSRSHAAAEPQSRVDLRELAQGVARLTQPRWQEQAQTRGVRILLETDLVPVPPIRGNAAELGDVLTNLIFNAVDALPNGGTISVRTRTEGDAVLVAVQDSGVGMSPEVRRRCLEPFYTTKGERGTGLGLAVAVGVLHRHHGTLRIDSAPGHGTTVSLCLPVASDLPPEPVGTADVALTRPLRILVADDDAWMRQLLQDYLTGDGHAVVLAADGASAWETFQREGARGGDAETGGFDLVLTDVAMPGLGGPELAQLIKGRAPPTPVVLLTGFGDVLQGTGTVPPEIDGVLSKPVSLGDLRRGLAAVVTGVGAESPG